MNIGSVPFPSIGYAISVSQGGRMSLPVPESSYLYSHFKHVSGVPAPEGIEGVNIDRLKILNTLIEQISRMKNEPVPAVELADTVEQENEKRINSLIDQYQNQIRHMQTASANNPYAPQSPQLGAIFSISV
jgi:hypothetical protein